MELLRGVDSTVDILPKACIDRPGTRFLQCRQVMCVYLWSISIGKIGFHRVQIVTLPRLLPALLKLFDIDETLLQIELHLVLLALLPLNALSEPV